MHDFIYITFSKLRNVHMEHTSTHICHVIKWPRITHLYWANVNFWFWHCTIVTWDVTTGEDRVKGKWDLSVLFLKLPLILKLFPKKETKTALTDANDHILNDSNHIKFYKRQINKGKLWINDWPEVGVVEQ